MKLFTAGTLHVSSLSIPVTVSAEDFAQALGRRPYAGAPATLGWGGIPYPWDSEDEVPPAPTRTSHHGTPAVVELGDGTRIVLARYLYDRPDRSLARRIGRVNAEGIAADALYVFDGVDVLAIPDDAEIRIYVASRDEKVVAAVLQAICHDLELGPPSEIDGIENPAAYLRPDADIFLWLIYRWETDPQLSPELRLTEYHTVSSTVGDSDETRFLNRVAFDRDEVLASICNAKVRFGPAKFALRDQVLGASVDLFLYLDGRFDVVVSESFMHMPGDPNPEIEARPFSWPGRSDLGVELAYTVAETIIPKLYLAYRRDKTWLPTEREAFRGLARQTLIARL